MPLKQTNKQIKSMATCEDGSIFRNLEKLQRTVMVILSGIQAITGEK
jgi:hypothetical protein